MQIKKYQDKKKGFLLMLVVLLVLVGLSATWLSDLILWGNLENKKILMAVLFGVIILCIYTGLLAYIAGKMRLSTYSLACYSFGKKGAYLVACLLGAAQVGWLGIGIGAYILRARSGLLEILPLENMGMMIAIAVSVASLISSGTLIPDVIRIFKDKKAPVTSKEIAILVGSSVLVGFGVIGAVLIKQVNIGKIIMGWLTLVNLLIPSIGGVIMADYYIIRKGKYIAIKNMIFTSVNKIAIGAWLLGAAAAYFLPGTAPVNSMLVAIIAYVALAKLFKMMQTEIGMQNRM